MKPFRTFDEQLEILKSRGLIFSDEDDAKKKLAYYGYYEIINGYKDFLLEPKADENDKDLFVENSAFEHIFALFKMDKLIRSTVLDATCDVEIGLRTAMSYVISKNIGENEKQYLVRKHYRPGKKDANGKGYKIDQLFRKFKNIINDDIQPMKHYKLCHKNVPPWIMLKGTTFGNLANFYTLQKPENKKEIISLMLEIPVELVNKEVVEMFTDIIFLCHSYRNRAAHGGRIYNYRSSRPIKYSQIFHKSEEITPADYRNGKCTSSLGTLLSSLKWLGNKTAYRQLRVGIEVAMEYHLKLYPDDFQLIISESEIKENELRLNL